jgi:putative transposase
MTGYDRNGIAVQWGDKDFGRIYRLAHAYDDLQSRWSQKNIKHHKRYRMKVAGRRIQEKIKNLVNDLHCKLVKWLVENYNLILLPKFETQEMVRRSKRRIRGKTAFAMLTWSHYKFQQRLLSKVREYPWCKVLIVDEHYTSKCCGLCGRIHWNLGGNKEFKCPYCNILCDRDIHAARNILLRFLTLNHSNEKNVFNYQEQKKKVIYDDNNNNNRSHDPVAMEPNSHFDFNGPELVARSARLSFPLPSLAVDQ